MDKTPQSDGVYQVVEARLTYLGQLVDSVLADPPSQSTIGGDATPWIYDAVRFDASGQFVDSADQCSTTGVTPPQFHQIFPTYSIYRNGIKVRDTVQCDIDQFFSLGGTSPLSQLKQADLNSIQR
jgi:hypothetical protein